MDFILTDAEQVCLLDPVFFLAIKPDQENIIRP